MKRYAIFGFILCVAVCPLAGQEASSSTAALEGYIGVYTQGNPRTRSNGIEISAVERGGPADEAGIRPGDVIISMGGNFPVTIDELRDLVRSFQPGERVEVSYRRGALISETYVIIGPAADTQTSKKQVQAPPTKAKQNLGQQSGSRRPKPLPQQPSAVPPQTSMRASGVVTKPTGTKTDVVTQAEAPRHVSESVEHTTTGNGGMASATPQPTGNDSPKSNIIPAQQIGSKPRVFVKGQGTVNATTHSGGVITGGDSWVFGHRSDTTVDAHDESIELSKDMREQCSGVIVTLREDSADFFVMLNRESKAKKGLLSKNNQVLVANKNGDVIWTKDVRQVKSAAKDVCSAILSGSK